MIETQQPTLWDTIERSIQQADKHSNYDWKVLVSDCLETVARSSQIFTADDVIELMESKHPTVTTHNLAALGPVFLAAQRRSMIANTNQIVQSRIPRRHRKITVWKSLVFKGEQQ